jgi:polysaccharide export outer membrane protein
MSWRRFASFLLACAGLAGALAAAAQPAAPAPAEPAYRLGPEDVLEISVWKEEALKKDVLVRPDGGLSFPLVGDVHAAGRTVDELRAELARRLQKFIPDPVVSVLLQRVMSNKIYVLGRVAKPGEFPAGRYVDVLQALSMAGGLTPFADEKDIRVLRREAGRQQIYRFDFKAVSRGEGLEQNLRLQGGDVVIVP